MTLDEAQRSNIASQPMIIADNAHVTYRVYASGKKLSARDKMFSVNALRGGRGLHTVPALRGVSFTASQGETIGVVGHNGSGKSTLFKAMSGLIPTSEGTIRAADRPVLLGVNAALMPDLSGENNIKIGLLAMGFSPEEAAAQVGPIADFAELNEFIHHPMRTYSSGMAARLRFAIASAKAHSILLVDEALAVGDRRFKMKSEKRIRELRDSAGLVMIVSHSAGSLRDTCERVLWIHKGELRADGDAKDVIADYVKWTKNPSAATVGAASVTKAKPGAKKVAPPAGAVPPDAASETKKLQPAGQKVSLPTQDSVPREPHVATKPADEDNALSLFDQLLRGLEPETPSEAAQETKRSIARTENDARAATRRERYQREAEKRVRKRIIATVITGGAILAAIGIGAAFALATSGAAATPLSVSSPVPETSATSVAVPQPVIVGFTAAKAPVRCASEDAEALATFAWEVTDATKVQLAVTSTVADSGDLADSIPAKAKKFTLPFPCASESESYTLTAVGEDGTRVSKAVTVAREIDPTAPPQDSSPNTPTQPGVPGTQTPVTGPTQPPTGTTPEPDPEPTVAPEPQPTDEPVIPVPEPTEEPPPTTEEPPIEDPVGETVPTT